MMSGLIGWRISEEFYAFFDLNDKMGLCFQELFIIYPCAGPIFAKADFDKIDSMLLAFKNRFIDSNFELTAFDSL